MKKYLLIVIAFIFVFSLSSCNNKSNVIDNKESCLNMIYEVDSGIYNEEKNFNHSNIVFSKPDSVIDNSAISKRKVKIDEVEMELDYSDTLYYAVGDKKVDRYLVNGEVNNVVLLNQYGEVNSILYKFTYLDISKAASPEQVLKHLEGKLNQYVNVSDYEYVDVPERSAHGTDGFGIYDFLFYNIIDGYITDYMKVSVSDDGGVLGLSINNLKGDNAIVDVNKKLETDMLNLKLNDIYTTSTTQYISYSYAYPPQVVVYNDAYYIQYYISVNYSHINNEDIMGSWINIILLPLELITNK